MNDTQLPIAWVSTSDEVTPLRTGAMRRDRKYVFLLGQFGPFTERVPLDDFDPNEIGRRVATLRAHLLGTQSL